MKKIVLISTLLIMLSACDNTTSPNISEPTPLISTTESSEIETTSESIQTQTENESIIEKIKAIQQPLSEISTEESDLFARNYNNDEPIFDDNGGYYYRILEDKKNLYLSWYYDNGDGKSIKTELPESEFYFYNALFHNSALYGILYENSTENRFIVKYQNESVEKLMDDSVDHWYFAEEGIYYQINNAIYLTDYDGINSELIAEIPDDLYIDSRHSRFVVYHGSIWYHHYSYLDKVDIPFWNYDLETKVFTQIDTGIFQAKLEAVNNGYLYLSGKNGLWSAKKGLWRLNTDTYCIEQVSERNCYSVNFFDDNIIFTTSQKEISEVYKINSDGMIKILDESNKEFGYDGPYYDDISIYENRIFLEVTYGENYGKIVEIDIDGNIIKQICDY